MTQHRLSASIARKRAHSSKQKATLAPRLAQALIRQEIDPVTETGTAATGFFFNELMSKTASRAGFRHPRIPTRCSGSWPQITRVILIHG